MKSIKEKAKEWCGEHSNKGCTEQCDDCWQLKQTWGCEQHNMETAYEAGANYVIDEIDKLVNFKRWAAQDLYNLIEQLKSN